ncbi:hypothetical protein KC332_g9805 [Hortaea werneckii]|uniref:Uncharacterized protein n=2 Tax=Hortaea werneckii TaxID=91943 RepID=A0A3M7GUP9_HORWE|nr:hypothetical protein KC358_g9675 [Hortaea werneckii]OTA37875.1 hypothetical protein BTJ68_02421 [Hortaea werneckii EXF-2000]KAI6824718.1 hypothetical protein KC350_g8956 [Hortaea werneckii]KAI6944591.1 hypothetical protein KC341_g715 [Hortaea werneckii]KAI6950191.1 hypothetical protein KC348_g812 [Hortaea werneckii]
MTGKDSHTQHRHRHRDRAKDTVQSAIDLKPPISFDQLLRRDRKSPLTGRHESPSQQQRNIEEWQVQQQIQQEREARARVTAQDVEKLRAENEKREQELARSLKEVEDMGMSSTRQLDDTYYAILEKASILRSTVASLQQLAEESRRMHQQFKDDSGALETDTRENFDHFNNFEEQEKTINELVTKLQSSKDETNKLNERLEKARTRIETYEQKQEAHRAKRRKQWHAVWGTLLGVILLVVTVLLLRHRRDVAAQMGVVGQKLAAAGDVVYGAGSNLSQSSPPEDPYLRQLFDEL